MTIVINALLSQTLFSKIICVNASKDIIKIKKENAKEKKDQSLHLTKIVVKLELIITPNKVNVFLVHKVVCLVLILILVSNVDLNIMLIKKQNFATKNVEMD